jgi:hypothetical protein
MRSPRRRHSGAIDDSHDGAVAGALAAAAVPLLVAAAMPDLPATQRSIPLAVGVLFVLAAAKHARRALQTLRRVRAELHRAATEWPTLCRSLAAATVAGLDLSTILHQLGYHEPATQRRLGRSARRWAGSVQLRNEVRPGPAAGTPVLGPFAKRFVRRVRLDLAEPPLPAHPLARIFVGSFLTATCGLELWLMRSRLIAWFLFGAMMGLGMLLGGIAAQLRRVRQRREIDRARGAWDQLGTAMAEAAAAGDSLVELLLQQGYRSFEVRQWLLRHFENQRLEDVQPTPRRDHETAAEVPADPSRPRDRPQ